MKAANERLQRIQEAQAARQEDLEHGRIRIERSAVRQKRAVPTEEPKKKSTN